MVPKQKHVHLASWQSQCQRTLYKEKRSKPKVLLVKYHWNHHLVLSLVSRSASAYHHHVSFVLQYHHGPKEVIRHDFTWKMERKWVSKCPKDFEEVTPLRFCLQRWWWNYLRDWSPMTVWIFWSPSKGSRCPEGWYRFRMPQGFPPGAVVSVRIPAMSLLMEEAGADLPLGSEESPLPRVSLNSPLVPNWVRIAHTLK